MGILGGILFFLALPLLIGYAISEKKNKMWMRLGLIMGGVALVLFILEAVVK